MENSEILDIIIAIVVFAIVISAKSLLEADFAFFFIAILFAAIILLVNIFSKKLAANSLDASVVHETWMWSRYGFRMGWKLPRPIQAGVFFPLILSIFSLGLIKCAALLTYETRALKRRSARKFGYYSFTEMTDWHNAMIGAAGILGSLILMIVAYALSPAIPILQGLPTLAAYYAFWNMIPFSKLDGNQILAGSRPLFVALALITLLATLATFAIS